jgi:hypothetical protein
MKGEQLVITSLLVKDVMFVLPGARVWGQVGVVGCNKSCVMCIKALIIVRTQPAYDIQPMLEFLGFNTILKSLKSI